jgi:hypothetical protein
VKEEVIVSNVLIVTVEVEVRVTVLAGTLVETTEVVVFRTVVVDGDMSKHRQADDRAAPVSHGLRAPGAVGRAGRA